MSGSTSPKSAMMSAVNLGAIFQPGTVLGSRYQILQMLGLGGMGAVYKARDTLLDRLVALKIIRPDLAADPSVVQRFKQEIILARQITHRNVVRVFDIGEADGVMFITMEFIEGVDLRGIVSDKGKLPPKEAVEIMWQVCCGLQAAHHEGVVHRDLKPGNIMRDSTGRVVVMDFGLATSLQTHGMTQSGAMLGTMEYMSPEQAKGSHTDARSDIFTTGLILYELLTGRMPYAAESAIASLVLRTQSNAKPLSEVEATVPKGLSEIVGRCLERDLNKRFQTVDELLGALDGYREHPSSAASTQNYNAAVTLKRWKRISILFAALVLIASTITAGFFVSRYRTRAIANKAPVTVLVGDFSNYTGDPIFDGTLEPMLNVALEGASFINAYNRGAARRIAETLPHPSDKLDEQTARLVAVSQGIGAIVRGELSRRGNDYQISAMLLDAVTGKVLSQSTVSAASKDDVLRAIPKLAAPIREALGDATPESDQLTAEAGSFTAASLEVVHQYSVALNEQYAGKMEDALLSFQKASELDPNFARAYAGMAAMAVNLGRRQDAEKYVKLAMEHVDRMTERERYRIRGMYYVASGDSSKCVEEYTELVTKYPADLAGHANLAGCLNYLRKVPEAIQEQRKAVEISPKSAGLRQYLSFYSSYGGDFQAGEREAREALKLSPSSDGYLALAEAQLGQGQLSQAADSYQTLAKTPSGISVATAGLADLAVYEGRYRDAVRLLDQGAVADLKAQAPDSAANKFAALARVQILQGQPGIAIASAEKALADSQSANIRFLVGQVYLDAGQTEKAEKLASELASELKAEPQAYGKILQGNVALKKGDFNSAITSISAANGLLDTWIGRFNLGRAYFEAGMYVEADSEFDRCLKRKGEALELFMDNVPTFGYFPAVYYYEGRVHEQLKSADYKDFYNTYLSIREKAGEDSLLPDVRKRLSS
jgi:tetratricopeptide (TPR) repeat protein